MRTKFLLMLIFGWFFATQAPVGSATSPEAKVTTIMGPFKTEGECQATRDEVEAFIKSIGAKPRIAPCIKKQEL